MIKGLELYKAFIDGLVNNLTSKIKGWSHVVKAKKPENTYLTFLFLEIFYTTKNIIQYILHTHTSHSKILQSK